MAILGEQTRCQISCAPSEVGLPQNVANRESFGLADRSAGVNLYIVSYSAFLLLVVRHESRRLPNALLVQVVGHKGLYRHDYRLCGLG